MSILHNILRISPSVTRLVCQSQNGYNIKSVNYIHTGITYNAVTKKTTSAAGGVLGLGKGKKKMGKMGPMEKKELPVETNPEKLVNYVCGSNIYVTGEDVKLKPDSEYPDWLWSLNTGAPPRIEDLDPNTKQYWIRVRAAGIRRKNRMRSFMKRL